MNIKNNFGIFGVQAPNEGTIKLIKGEKDVDIEHVLDYNIVIGNEDSIVMNGSFFPLDKRKKELRTKFKIDYKYNTDEGDILKIISSKKNISSNDKIDNWSTAMCESINKFMEMYKDKFKKGKKYKIS